MIKNPPKTQNGQLEDEAANFETAISATGFGWYNLLLIVIIFPAGWANTLESTTMSYVSPVAQCDLDISLEDKGVLNAITYSGMISSAMLWGFLFDTLGRRKLLMIGYFFNFLCIVITSMSQSKQMLIASKFFGGFIINGPYSALATYISEFHSARNRDRMQLFISVAVCIGGGLALPWVAWAILSKNYHFTVGTLQIYSWNIFLLITSLPAFVTTLVFSAMPESPKFLMTVGKNEKAMTIFRKVYSTNTGKPQDTYPVKRLVDETEMNKVGTDCYVGKVTARRSAQRALMEGWQQMKPLFFPPHVNGLLLVCFIQMFFTMSVNTFRLWLPQIFQALNDYQYFYNETYADLCKSLNMIRTSNGTDDCSFNTDNQSVYMNSMIVNVTVIVFALTVSYLIHTIRKKLLLFILGIFAGGCAFALYFAFNIQYAVAFASLFTGASTAAANVVLTITLTLFPTTLRTMSVSVTLMCGRIGSMVGNLMFPLLIQAGCAPPFFTIGSILIVCAFLSLFLPDVDLKTFE